MLVYWGNIRLYCWLFYAYGNFNLELFIEGKGLLILVFMGTYLQLWPAVLTCWTSAINGWNLCFVNKINVIIIISHLAFQSAINLSSTQWQWLRPPDNQEKEIISAATVVMSEGGGVIIDPVLAVIAKIIQAIQAKWTKPGGKHASISLYWHISVFRNITTK